MKHGRSPRTPQENLMNNVWFLVLGIPGKVGGTATRQLLEEGQPARVLNRDSQQSNNAVLMMARSIGEF